MDAFTYRGASGRVVFGRGTLARLPAELRALGRSRAVILSTPAQADDAQALADAIGELSCGVLAEAVMHTPVEVTEKALRRVAELRADCLVAVGGGSTVGLGKAIALRTGLDQVVVPTTYAGSEMTPILGETRGGSKTTLLDEAVRPELVIYDVDLTLTLPAGLSVTSGLNAIAHAVEALYAQDRNPITSLMAEEAIGALARALPGIVADPRDGAARSTALYGAWLAGTCLGQVGMALHHKLCHTLGGTFGLPHADTHAVVLPHAAAYNASHAADAMARVARALGAETAADGLFALGGRLAAPRSLRALGMPEAGIDRATDLAVQNPYWNPRPMDRAAIRELIARAWAGEPPRPAGA